MIRLFKWFEVEPNNHELKEVTFDVVSKDDDKIVIQIHTEANKPNRRKREVYWIDLMNNDCEDVGGGHYAFEEHFEKWEKTMNLIRLYGKEKIFLHSVEEHKRYMRHCQDRLETIRADIKKWEAE